MSDKKPHKDLSQRLADGEYLEAWRQFKDEHPVAYGVSAVLPVTGQAAAAADYADAMDRDDSIDGTMAAASFIPGVKLAKYASKLAPASLRLKSQMNPVERAIAPVTKRTTPIARAMNAEQISEAAGKVGQEAAVPPAPSAAERERGEFAAAFGEGV